MGKRETVEKVERVWIGCLAAASCCGFLLLLLLTCHAATPKPYSTYISPMPAREIPPPSSPPDAAMRQEAEKPDEPMSIVSERTWRWRCAASAAAAATTAEERPATVYIQPAAAGPKSDSTLAALAANSTAAAQPNVRFVRTVTCEGKKAVLSPKLALYGVRRIARRSHSRRRSRLPPRLRSAVQSHALAGVVASMSSGGTLAAGGEQEAPVLC